MSTHFSILAWRIPWTEEPGGLQSIELQESDTTEQLSTAQNSTQLIGLLLGLNTGLDSLQTHGL